MQPEDPRRASSRPPTVQVAGVLVLLEGLGVLAGAAYLGVESAVGEPGDPATAWLASGLALLAAAGLLAVGAALVRRRRWARSPAVVTQLLVLPVGLPLVSGGQYAAGVPLVLLAVLGLVLLFHPATGRTLDDGTLDD